ncbi:MAG: flagellar hook-length control protein FliK [Pirellulaceae bacterium]|nr:flagellar hook-length control protein FliK [Pirellulaceae bacterium]
MTPSSSDRARSISPLDSFGPAPHPMGQAAPSAQAFEAMLNKVPAPSKAALLREPLKRASVERPAKELETRSENASERSTAATRRKQQAKADPLSEPQRKAIDRKPSDEPHEDLTTCPPASDSSQSCPVPQAVQEGQDESGEAETQVDAATEEVPSDKGEAAPPIVAIAEKILDTPLQPGSSSPPVSSGSSISLDEGIQAAHPTELILAEPSLPGEAAIPSSEFAATVHGNGPLSLAEPGQDSPAVADPETVIEGQLGAEEIQSAEPGGNGGQKKDSGENAGETSDTQDVVPPEPPAAEALTSPEIKNAAAPPPATDATASPKDASQPQQASSHTTAGGQTSPNRLPQHVLARSETHQMHNPVPVPVDSARFLSRVAKAFLSAQQRDGEVRLRLSPPELGSLRLQVSVQEGVMVARLETETEAARSTLVSNLPALRERLAEQGVRIERFDIDLMQRPPTGTPDRPSDPQQQHEPEPLRLLRTQNAASEVPKAAAPTNNWNGQGRLNVII